MKRCPYCFKPLSKNGICDCHYDDNPDPQVLKPGSIVGACYQIGGVMGQGGFGITYHGFDLDLEKDVAIKEFFPSGMVTRAKCINDRRNYSEISQSKVITLDSNSEIYAKSLDMFYKEAKALAKLSKISNIVHVHRIFQENNTAYIVMDFVRGKSLLQLLSEKGKFSESELLPLLDPILTALENVHKEGILHRDIAPDNIIIDEDGQPILLDFGASKTDYTQGAADKSGPKSSLLVMKKGYTPIEQIHGSATIASDIYALGATYYHLLSGKVPPHSYDRITKDKIVPLTQFGVSENTNDVLMKALAMNAKDRWQSTAAFQTALNKKGKEKVSKKKKIKCKQKTGSILIFAAFGALILTGLLIFAMYQPNQLSVEQKTETAWVLLQKTWDQRWTAEAEKNKAALTTESKIKADTSGISKTAVNTPTKTQPPTATFSPVPTKTARPTSTKAPVPTKRVRPTSTSTPVENKFFAADIMEGDTVTFGKYEQDNNLLNGAEPIEWIVIDIDYSSMALLLSKNALDAISWHDSIPGNKSEPLNWNQSSLKKWLNNNFLNKAFNTGERKQIRKNSDGNLVSLLSNNDVKMYFPNPMERLCKPTAYAAANGAWQGSHYALWWLRDTNSDTGTTRGCYVDQNGNIVNYYPNVKYVTVRPAIWVNIK